MREKIDCFLPCNDPQAASQIVSQLRGSKTIQHIFLLVAQPIPETEAQQLKDCYQIEVGNLNSSNTIMSIAENAKADYVLLQTKVTQLELGLGALDRMADEGHAVGAGAWCP